MVLMPILPIKVGRIASPAPSASAPCSFENAWPACGVGMLNSTDRIKGLIRLLCIGLRVLCLVEYAVREALREKSEKLAGIYAGNPKRSTARPTTEMMLKAFEGITRVTVSHNGTNLDHVTPLNAVQTRILSLLGFPMSIYQRLAAQS